MNLFVDTSALIKRYIDENGSENIDALMNQADRVLVSAITEIEAHSIFKRLFTEKAIDNSDYGILLDEFGTDYQFYSQIGLDDHVAANAKTLIAKYQLKALDSIQLGTAVLLKDEINFFVASDEKLITAGKKEGLKIIDPRV